MEAPLKASGSATLSTETMKMKLMQRGKSQNKYMNEEDLNENKACTRDIALGSTIIFLPLCFPLTDEKFLKAIHLHGFKLVKAAVRSKPR
jgi:hypothetical protein